MNTPVAALTWEIWRKNRFGFWLLLVFLLVAVGLSRVAVHLGAEASQLATKLAADAPELLEATAHASDWFGFATVWSELLLGVSLLVTFAAFSFTESNTLRGFGGIPSRLFTLPVRTRQLVALPVGIGVCFVVLLYLAWSRLVLTAFLPTDGHMPDGYLVLLLSATLVGFQALVWVLPGFPRTRATLLILLAVVVTFLGALPFVDLARWPERRMALMTTFAGLLVAAPMVASVGVKRLRKGEWRDWPSLTALMTRVADVFSRRREFSSPVAALFWIECRRIGRPALGGLAIYVLIITALGTYWVLKDGVAASLAVDVFGGVASPILMLFVSIWTPVLGLLACGDAVSRRRWMTTLQATRPVTVGEMAVAKLKAMIAIWLAGWLLVIAGVTIWALACAQTDALLHRFTNVWDARVIAMMAVISLHVLIGLFPLWLTGRMPELPWSFVVLYIAYGGVTNVITWFDRHPQHQNVALLLIGFAAAVKLGVASAAFRQGLKRHLITWRFVFSVTAIWMVGTTCLIRLIASVADRADWNEVLILPFSVLLFPFARIALAPLALAMNRHR